MNNDHVHPIFQPILNGIAEPDPVIVYCEDCETRHADGDDGMCSDCRDNAAEAAWERAQEEPCFRGGEWEAAQRAELEAARRLK